jgi:hypothetical protein
MTWSTSTACSSTPSSWATASTSFADGTTPTALELIDTSTTSRGVVVHVYQASGKPDYGSVALEQESDVVTDSLSRRATT